MTNVEKLENLKNIGIAGTPKQIKWASEILSKMVDYEIMALNKITDHSDPDNDLSYNEIEQTTNPFGCERVSCDPQFIDYVVDCVVEIYKSLTASNIIDRRFNLYPSDLFITSACSIPVTDRQYPGNHLPAEQSLWDHIGMKNTETLVGMIRNYNK